MESSGTFISDLKKEVLDTDTFKGLSPAAEKSGAIGDIVLNLSDSLLDYILACIDVEKAKDAPCLADAVCRSHITIMASIITHCKPT